MSLESYKKTIEAQKEREREFNHNPVLNSKGHTNSQEYYGEAKSRKSRRGFLVVLLLVAIVAVCVIVFLRLGNNTLKGDINSLAYEVIDDNSWVLEYPENEFGEKTNDGYALNESYGDYAADAVSRRKVKLLTLVRPNNVGFFVVIYGSTYYLSGALTCRAKIMDGTIITFSAKSDRDKYIAVKESDVEIVKKLLTTNSEILLAIDEPEGFFTRATTYRFTIKANPNKLKSILSKLN